MSNISTAADDFNKIKYNAIRQMYNFITNITVTIILLQFYVLYVINFS